jgi:cytochrome P450
VIVAHVSHSVPRSSQQPANKDTQWVSMTRSLTRSHSANLEIIATAVEELRRYCSFVNRIRTATRDIEFHAASMKAGDRIVLAAALAARDLAEFDRP